MTLTEDFTEKINFVIQEGADEFLDYCKRLYDAFLDGKNGTWGFRFSWSWFVKGVKALPKYNLVRTDVPKIFSTPMGSIGFTPFSKNRGSRGSSCTFWLSFSITTRKQIQEKQ